MISTASTRSPGGTRVITDLRARGATCGGWHRGAPGRRTGHVLQAVVGLLLALAVAPPLAVLPPLATWVRTRTSAHRARQQRDGLTVAGLPDAVDLLLLGTGAGWSLPVAHPLVARRVPPPLGTALEDADLAAARGRPRADALVDALTPLGDRARALAQVLADHLRYGVALTPALERLSLELRLDRRRRAEVAARRVPVRLLGPLVLCILPSFALLTVVPLLGASLRGLPT
jgi:Flp pilus assembly protein TadB